MTNVHIYPENFPGSRHIIQQENQQKKVVLICCQLLSLHYTTYLMRQPGNKSIIHSTIFRSFSLGRMQLLLIALLSFSNSFSQSGWSYLTNAPVSNYRFDDLYFINDSTGWAVNGEGRIYKTADFGNSWTLQMDSLQYYFRSIEFLNDTTGFAGTLNGKVFKTTDAGQTWTRIDQNFPLPVPGVCGMEHWGNLIIIQGIWSQPAYILRSTDAGQTWSYTNMSTFASGLVDGWFKSQDTVFISGIGTDITSNHGIILRSTDAGLTWNQVGMSTAASAYCWKLQFTSADIGYCSLSENLGSQSHILKTTDGGSTWTTMFVTNQNMDMEGIGFVNDSIGWLGGWSPGMWQTIDGGNSWTFLNFGGNLNRYIFRNQSLAYAGGISIYKFSGLTTGLPGISLQNHLQHSLKISPNPVCDAAHIYIDLMQPTTAVIEVYDERGQMIKRLKDNLEKGEHHYELQHLKAGTYFAVLKTNEHFLTKEFQVIK